MLMNGEVSALHSRIGSELFPFVWCLPFGEKSRISPSTMSRKEWKAENYYSKDFDWERLREEVETDPSLHFHLLPENTPNLNDEDSAVAWDKFHARHSTGKFFKERRYLLKEFPELASCEDNSKVLEVGCGNGSTALPILCGREGIILYACDCSSTALEKAKEIISSANSLSANARFNPFLCDFSTTGFPSWLACNTCTSRCNGIDAFNSLCPDGTKCCIGGVDFVTLIFTLSALPPDRMPKAIAQCFAVLKPGGLLLFRDYGLYDMTMLRFEPENRIGYREYLRSDGTRSYFFCLNTIRSLTTAAGFTVLELEYCCVRSVNRRKGKIMNRVWVHGKFQKPTGYLKKSEENKAKNDKERLDSYYKRNYKDYFGLLEGELKQKKELSESENDILEWLERNRDN
ncbi:methyltransferase [Striga asiatica]|uniref:Methyltransferase n=1 Tax=Striga asiatica TaxID=4170 RepID=A0A5A7R1H2_STRAF|nr:methyltransferase [Striga asiatica]